MNARHLLLAMALLLPSAVGATPPSPDTGAEGVGQAATAMRVEVQRAEVLSQADRERVRTSLGYVVEHDPYSRAALTLPYVMQDALTAVPDDAVDVAGRNPWHELQEGIAQHVELLNTLGMPAPADPTVVGLAQDMRLIVEQARKQTVVTQLAIEEHSARLESLTGIARPCPRGPWSAVPGHPWTLGMQLRDWDRALASVRPHASDQARVTIDQLTALMAAYDEATQAQRSAVAL